MAVQQSEPTIEQRILALEVTGKLADAAACYERAAHPPRLEHLKGLVRCYLDLDNVNTALNVMQGASEKQPEWESELMELQAEALWRLGRYEDLEEVFGRPDFEGNGSKFSKLSYQVVHKDKNLFQACTAAGAYKSAKLYRFSKKTIR